MKIDLKKIGQIIGANTNDKASASKSGNIITRVCDFIIGASLFMVFFGLPLFFTGITFQGVAFEKQMYFFFWTLLALVVWAIKGVIAGEMKIKRTPLDIPIVAFLAVYVLSVIFSKDHWHSFWGLFGDPSRGLANVIMIVIAYYVILSNLTAKKFKMFLGGLVFANLIVAVWTSLVIFGINFVPDKIAQFAPLNLMGSFTGLTIYFSVMIPLLIAAAFSVVQSTVNKIMKWAAIFLVLATIVLNLFLLLALYSFVSWISWMALLVGVVMVLVYMLSKIVKLSNFSWVWLPMGVFMVIMVFIMSGQVFKIVKINLPAEVSLNYSNSWNIAKDTVKSGFSIGAVGSGPATYGYDFSLFRPKEFNLNALYNLRFYQGTGMFFEALPTIGAVGVVFMLIPVLSYLSIGFYHLSRSREGNKLYSLGLFSASVIFLINAFSTRIEGSILLLGSLISMLALAALLKESDSRENYLDLSLKASPKFALALAFIFMVIASGVIFLFVFIGKVFMADTYFGMANRNQQANENTLNKMSRAISLYKYEPKYFVQLSQAYAILANQEALKAEGDKDTAKIQGYLNNSIAAANQAKSLSGNDVSVVENLAQIYENAGFYVADSFSLAEDNYKKAQELEPHNPNFLVKLGQIKINTAGSKKDIQEKKAIVEEARDIFQKSIDEKSNFDAGYYNLALAKEALGDLDGAIDNVTKAYSIDRSNITYAFVLGRLYSARGKNDDNKIAETLFKQILTVNSKEVNAHFYLGMLYEKTQESGKAIDEYQEVINLLPADAKDAKDKISSMIDNIGNGISNFQNNLAQPQNNQ